MQITLNLPDYLLLQLLQQPNPEQFAQQAIAMAIQQQETEQPSRWAKLAARVEKNPISLGNYAETAKQDGKAFRESLVFQHDVTAKTR